MGWLINFLHHYEKNILQRQFILMSKISMTRSHILIPKQMDSQNVQFTIPTFPNILIKQTVCAICYLIYGIILRIIHDGSKNMFFKSRLKEKVNQANFNVFSSSDCKTILKIHCLNI